jgi:hypothetical protein
MRQLLIQHYLNETLRRISGEARESIFSKTLKTLLYSQLRLPWEAKDEKGNLDDEIELKFRHGYP